MDKGKGNAGKKDTWISIFSSKNIIPQIEKFFDSRNKQVFAVILIIGILLMTIPSGEKKTASKSGSEEERLCRILSSIEGCGEVTVMITYHGEDKNKNIQAKGAVVVAEGAGEADVRNKLSTAVQAALDLPPHKVVVQKLK